MTLVLSRNEWLECSVLVARSCAASVVSAVPVPSECRVAGSAESRRPTPVGPRPPYPVLPHAARRPVVHYTHPDTRLPFVSCLGSNAKAIRHSLSHDTEDRHRHPTDDRMKSYGSRRSCLSEYSNDTHTVTHHCRPRYLWPHTVTDHCRPRYLWVLSSSRRAPMIFCEQLLMCQRDPEKSHA